MGPDAADPRRAPDAAWAGATAGAPEASRARRGEPDATLKPPAPAPAGTGFVRIDRAGTRSIVTRVFATSPLRLLHPRNHGDAAWIYTASYGGGLVDGDAIQLTVDVGPGAAALLSTQASTKIYRSPAGTGVDVEATVAPGGLLVAAPDPVVCFAGASYRQVQRVQLARSAGLVLVDGLTSGRREMGERWAFDSCVTRLTVRREGRPIVFDSLALRSADGDLRARMGRFNVLCAIVILGSAVREHAARIVSRIAESPVIRCADVLCAAGAIGEDGCVVRMAATSLEPIAHAVREHLRFVPALLGDDPWTRKW